ncbi:MAG TPA: aconitase family protein, partial [Clostridia bacterium]
EKVSGIGPIRVDQVAIGSCTNSSYMDMIKVAKILKGKTVHPNVSLVIAPGSKQVLTMLAKEGALADLVAAGARILESACGPCIGMGQAPATDAVSLRTFNRNFEGRSGTKSAKVYLVSPETAAASAITGVLTDPRTLGEAPEVSMPESFYINDNMIVPPAPEGEEVEVVRGPNIKPFPVNKELPDKVEGTVLIKVGDNITTDHIMPSNAKLLPFRSNVPYLAEYCLTPCDPDFPKRAKENGGGFIVGGSNYGQGSSREHAALAPLQLGVRGVLAKSFARIHMANLINSGILPMTFADEADYDRIKDGDVLVLENAREQIKAGDELTLVNKTANTTIKVKIALSDRQKDIMLAGGLLNYTKKQGQ